MRRQRSLSGKAKWSFITSAFAILPSTSFVESLGLNRGSKYAMVLIRPRKLPGSGLSVSLDGQPSLAAERRSHAALLAEGEVSVRSVYRSDVLPDCRYLPVLSFKEEGVDEKWKPGASFEVSSILESERLWCTCETSAVLCLISMALVFIRPCIRSDASMV